MAAEERTLGQLVSDASRDVSELVRYEIALAKAEVQRDIKRGVAAGGLFGAAGLLAVYATIALMIAAGLGLAEVMPAWLAFLIVALGLLLIAGVCVVVGRAPKSSHRSGRSARRRRRSPPCATAVVTARATVRRSGDLAGGRPRPAGPA
jgi:hypothetical protein